MALDPKTPPSVIIDTKEHNGVAVGDRVCWVCDSGFDDGKTLTGVVKNIRVLYWRPDKAAELNVPLTEVFYYMADGKCAHHCEKIERTNITVEDILGCEVEAVEASVSSPFSGVPVIQLGKLILKDGREFHIEGEHDVAYIPIDPRNMSKHQLMEMVDCDEVMEDIEDIEDNWFDERDCR